MPDSYDRLRRPLQHWTMRAHYHPRYRYADGFVSLFDRGDAYMEMLHGSNRQINADSYAALIKLVEVALDKYVAEARCKESGGHEYEEWGEVGDKRCVKCLDVQWADA